jgi:hypothetical protein
MKRTHPDKIENFDPARITPGRVIWKDKIFCCFAVYGTRHNGEDLHTDFLIKTIGIINLKPRDIQKFYSNNNFKNWKK